MSLFNAPLSERLKLGLNTQRGSTWSAHCVITKQFQRLIEVFRPSFSFASPLSSWQTRWSWWRLNRSCGATMFPSEMKGIQIKQRTSSVPQRLFAHHTRRVPASSKRLRNPFLLTFGLLICRWVFVKCCETVRGFCLLQHGDRLLLLRHLFPVFLLTECFQSPEVASLW